MHLSLQQKISQILKAWQKSLGTAETVDLKMQEHMLHSAYIAVKTRQLSEVVMYIQYGLGLLNAEACCMGAFHTYHWTQAWGWNKQKCQWYQCTFVYLRKCVRMYSNVTKHVDCISVLTHTTDYKALINTQAPSNILPHFSSLWIVSYANTHTNTFIAVAIFTCLTMPW